MTKPRLPPYLIIDERTRRTRLKTFEELERDAALEGIDLRARLVKMFEHDYDGLHRACTEALKKEKEAEDDQ